MSSGVEFDSVYGADSERYIRRQYTNAFPAVMQLGIKDNSKTADPYFNGEYVRRGI